MGLETPNKPPPGTPIPQPQPPTETASSQISSDGNRPVTDGSNATLESTTDQPTTGLEDDLLPTTGAAPPAKPDEKGEIELKKSDLYKALTSELPTMGNLLDDYIEQPTAFRRNQLFSSVKVVELWKPHLPALLAKKLSVTDHVALHAVISSLNQLVKTVQQTLQGTKKTESKLTSTASAVPEVSDYSRLTPAPPYGFIGHVAPLGPGENSTSTGTNRESQQPFTPRPTPMPEFQQPTHTLSGETANSVLYAHWFSRETLSDLPSFGGGTAEYLRWKAQVFPLLKMDTRGKVVTFNSLRKILRGDALQKVSRIEVTGPDPVGEAFALLDKLYNQPGVVLSTLMEQIENLATPNASDPESLDSFITSVKKTIQGFAAANQPIVGQWWFYLRIVLKLPVELARSWVAKTKPEDLTVENLLGFLEFRERTLRALPQVELARRTSKTSSEKPAIKAAAARSGQHSSQQRENPGKPTDDSDSYEQQHDDPASNGSREKRARPVRGACPQCKANDHDLECCPAFLQLTPTRRLENAFKWCLHYVCLVPHRKGKCPKRGNQRCTEEGCPFKHHPLLHGADYNSLRDKVAQRSRTRSTQDPGSESSGKPSKPGVRSAVAFSPSDYYGFHLRLVRIFVRAGAKGTVFSVVALIDGGCSHTLIDEEFACRMGLHVDPENCLLRGVHGGKQTLMADVQFELRSRSSDYVSITASTCKDLSMPGPELRWRDWARRNPPFNRIADELENVHYNDIKIFLGLNVEDLTMPLEGSRYLYSEDRTVRAFRTRLGWTIAGPADENDGIAAASVRLGNNLEGSVHSWEEELLAAFRFFNDLESIGIVVSTNPFSPAEQRELDRMKKLAQRLPDGRWEIPMLTKIFQRLPSSEPQARKRLRSLHQRLAKDARLRKLYVEGIRSDEAKGYIRKLSSKEASDLRYGSLGNGDLPRGGNPLSQPYCIPPVPHWFLPHFPVFHPDKPDKCRRVLDAAATNEGVSLNSFLHVGPNILQSLFGILLRFRLGPIAVNADITEHFSQVAIPPEQQNLVAFLWNEDPEEEPDVYVNRRHIFGAACSPAVAIFALSKATESEPDLQAIVESSFYMDDFYWSGETTDEVISTSKRVESSLAANGFQLSKWMSNDPEVVKSWPLDDRAKALKPLGDNLEGPLPKVKALGVAWDCDKDTITFQTRKSEAAITTVASVLSVLASFYDPFGIAAPFTFNGKRIFQSLWHEIKDWKSAVPEVTRKKWGSWMDQLPIISTLSIPRWYGFTAQSELVLHAFSDASNVGMGAVIYLATFQQQPVFIAAKTKVVPISKQDNIPRLELQAVLIAVRTAKTVKKELSKSNITKVYFWSDSSTALQWINNDDVRYESYVSNRVSEIREIVSNLNVEVNFRFVPTHQNPADLASRGVEKAADFVRNFHFWCHGPEFLRDPESEWPPTVRYRAANRSVIGKQVRYVMAVKVQSPTPQDDNLVSFLKRATQLPNPTIEDINQVEISLIREAQKDVFATEIRMCQRSASKAAIRHGGPLIRRQIWLDSDGVLHLQTRLYGSEGWSSSQTLPIALPKKHPFTTLVIKDAHRQVEHQGVASTMAKVHERFFIPQGKPMVKKLCFECSYCLTRDPRPMCQPRAPLHHSRLQVNCPPWTQTGMDHFGPFEINRRSKKWGLIFICLTTRAIHLEDVDGPGVEPFCLAFDRFLNRRGRPESLRSDKGSAFLALSALQNKTCDEYAAELQQAALSKFRINLHFNPAGAPNWGGSWERPIHEVKKIIKSAHDNTGKWRADDFRTFLVRAEGIINRRPIAFGDDGEILTPQHFLNPSASVPVGPPLGSPSLKSLLQIKRAEQLLWQKWVKFYLPSIAAERVLGPVRNDVLLPGDKVLLREGSNPLVNVWTPATIVETYTTPKDGVIRSALLDVKGSKVIRDASRICIIDGPVLQRKKPLPSPSGMPTTGAPLGGMSAPDKK